jgi:hypothetical protein
MRLTRLGLFGFKLLDLFSDREVAAVSTVLLVTSIESHLLEIFYDLHRDRLSEVLWVPYLHSLNLLIRRRYVLLLFKFKLWGRVVGAQVFRVIYVGGSVVVFISRSLLEVLFFFWLFNVISSELLILNYLIRKLLIEMQKGKFKSVNWTLNLFISFLGVVQSRGYASLLRGKVVLPDVWVKGFFRNRLQLLLYSRSVFTISSSFIWLIRRC